MPKPKVVIFNGVSLDGRMDGVEAQIDMGLYYQTAASWNADAMLSGSSTMLVGMGGVEEPPLGAETSGPKELHPLAVPYLVVADSRGRFHQWRALQAQPYWREVVALCSHATPHRYMEELEQAGVRSIIAGEERVDFRQALEELNQRFGVQTVRVDSGGTLNGVLLRAGLVDEVSLLLAPLLIGGETPRSFFVAPDIHGPEQAIPLRLFHCEQLESGVLWLRYEIVEKI